MRIEWLWLSRLYRVSKAFLKLISRNLFKKALNLSFITIEYKKLFTSNAIT